MGRQEKDCKWPAKSLFVDFAVWNFGWNLVEFIKFTYENWVNNV